MQPSRTTFRVEEFVREDGSVPYRRWFDSLDPQATTRVATAVYRMEQGNLSNVKWFAGIGEYVIDWGPGYRVYLAKDGESLIILFGGGTKRDQRADIERAKALWQEYKRRKHAAGSNRVRPQVKKPR